MKLSGVDERSKLIRKKKKKNERSAWEGDFIIAGRNTENNQSQNPRRVRHKESLPGGPVAGTPHSQWGPDFASWWGN